MVVRLGILELDMETVLDSDLHLDRYLTFILKFWVGELHCEVHFLNNLGVVVTVDAGAYEIADLTSESIEAFVLLLELSETESERLIVVECSSRLQLLGHSHKICGERLVGEYFEVTDKLDADAEMFELLIVVKLDSNSTADVVVSSVDR